MKSTTKVLAITFISMAIMLGMVAQVQAAPVAVGISCPGEVRIGNTLSCKLTGLTVGSNYIVNAQHSDGNLSKVLTATASTEYVRFVFTSADANNVVPIALGDATSAGALTGGDDATALVNLISPASDIPSAFFQLLLAPMLIIGVFILLMGAFFIKRKKN